MKVIIILVLVLILIHYNYAYIVQYRRYISMTVANSDDDSKHRKLLRTRLLSKSNILKYKENNNIKNDNSNNDNNSFNDDSDDDNDDDDSDSDDASSISGNTFREMSMFPDWIVDRCEGLGYIKPTLVQRRTIPSILQGKDVVFQAQTGSGKTLAYGLPVLNSIDPNRAAIQAVIVVPSRELGLQITGVLKQIATGSPKRIMIMPLVEGSLNRRQQLWAIADPPHIIVGNPKSLQRLVDLGRLRLNAVSFLVLDEVDACLLNTETKEDLHLLLSRKLSNSYQGQEQKEQELSESLVYRNKAGKQRDLKMNNMQYRISRQTIMCSASIPQRQHFASICKQNGWTETLPELIHVSSKCLVPPQVKHEYVQVKEDLKVSCLRYLLQKEMTDWKPMSSDNFQAIVFIDTPAISNDILNAASSIMKKENEHSVEYLSDDMNLDEMAKVITSFREGRCNILICTDIIERGIDIPNVSHVFQYNLPDTVEGYLHRTGRAGRLGREGKVITIIKEEENFVVNRYSNALGKDITERKLNLKKKEN